MVPYERRPPCAEKDSHQARCGESKVHKKIKSQSAAGKFGTRELLVLRKVQSG